MPTPVGFVDYALQMDAVGDPEPWFVTWGCATDLANFSAVEHCNDAFASFVTPFDDHMGDFITFTKVIGRFGQDGGPDLIVESDLVPSLGQSPQTYLPQNSAVLIKKNTGLGGRRNRGRMFVPGLAGEASVSNLGVVVESTRLIWQGVADAFLAALEATNGGIVPSQPMQVLHTPDPITGVAPAPTPVSSLTVASTIATQRRRLRR